MSLPTWNKMAMDVKLSAQKRYEILRSEINSIGKGSDNSSEVKKINKEIADIKKRIEALENEGE